MNNIVFSNRMGPRTLLYVALVFVAIAIVFFSVGRRQDFVLLFCIVVGLFIATLLMIWLVVVFTAKNNVAELTMTADGLQAEMIDIMGQGEKISLPHTQPDDWTWEIDRYGKGKQQKTAVIKLLSGQRTLKLWLSGAKVVNIDAFQTLAPHVVAEMRAAGFLK